MKEKSRQMAVKYIRNRDIPRVPYESLSIEEFQDNYFSKAKPVIITGLVQSWPCYSKWTIEGLMQRVGDNEVLIRGKTNQEDYKQGKSYTIRRDTFRNYCQDLLQGNARARSSYLAVASLQQAFPQLLEELPLPEYLTANGKIHLGPYMWVALAGHYEFNHFDPDDNFLIQLKGRKQIRLFGLEYLESLYPNKLGSQGKTIQSQVNLDNPDLEKYPLFATTECEHTVLHPGDMLFIPAFYWHQVSALDSGVSCNIFYGNGGDNHYLEKVLQPPYREHFKYWLLNIIEQNRAYGETFTKIVHRLPEVLRHFFLKQWHEVANDEQIKKVIEMIEENMALPIIDPSTVNNQSKFPPPLKIRGLRGRVGKED